MNKTLKNLVCAGMILTGAGLASDAFFQKDGKMDKKDAIEYTAGLLLTTGALSYYASSPKKNYKVQ